MSIQSYILLITFLSVCPVNVKAQLNTGGAPYLTTVAAATYLNSPGPYSIPKKIAKLNDTLFVTNEDRVYQSIGIEDSEYAVYTNKRGKKKAYQILYSNNQFTLFCQHYVEQDCDCFEGLAMAGNDNEKPIIVRELWPFSLKVNLIDRLNEFYKENLNPDDFDKVCDIIEYVQTQ